MTIKASALRVLQIFKDERSQDIHIPLGQVRGSTGLVTTATPADGVWAYSIATFVHSLVSNTSDGTTKTSTGTFTWRVPDNWHPSQTLTLRVGTKLISVTGTGVTNNGSDIDATVYKQDALAVGSDLCGTAAATYAALDTRYDKDFTIDMTGVRAGDMMVFNIIGRAIESNAGNGTLQSQVEKITLVLSEPS